MTTMSKEYNKQILLDNIHEFVFASNMVETLKQQNPFDKSIHDWVSQRDFLESLIIDMLDEI